MSFKKYKIKGISFTHRANGKFAKQTYKLQDFFNVDELYLQIKSETPNAFSSADIRRLLGDHGRNEINSQISRCVDFSSKWIGILKVIERCFPDKYFLNAEYLSNNSDVSLNNATMEESVEIYLLIKKLIGLWKHNLAMLEMTAQAQHYI